MKRKNFRRLSATERRYEISLRQAAQEITRSIKRLKTVNEIISALTRYTENPKWVEYANREALRMVKSVMVENAVSWREAARKGQNGSEIYRLLKNEFAGNPKFNALVEQNANYIKLLPANVAKSITAKASKSAMAGVRPEAILRQIQEEAPELAEWQATRIARTEVSKAQASITSMRSQAIGLDFYVWKTSSDQRVRSSHKHMEGVICSFSNPPNPEAILGVKSGLGNYGPGECPNCRCYAEPIIDPDFETWPKKIAQGNKIVSIGKKDFLKLQDSP